MATAKSTPGAARGGGILATQLQSLSPTMRMAAAFLAVLMAFSWILILWWFVGGSLSTSSADLKERKQKLAMVESQVRQYQQWQTQITASEQQLGGGDAIQPSALIEKLTEQNNVRQSLRAVEEMGSEQKGHLKQTRYRIELSKVPYGSFSHILYDLETSGAMQVESADLHSARVGEEKMVNATLVVLAFELMEGE